MLKAFQKPAPLSLKMPLSKHATPLALRPCQPLLMIQVLKLMPCSVALGVYSARYAGEDASIKTIWKTAGRDERRATGITYCPLLVCAGVYAPCR